MDADPMERARAMVGPRLPQASRAEYDAMVAMLAAALSAARMEALEQAAREAVRHGRLAWDNHGADLDDVLNNFAHHIAAAIRNLAGPSVPPSKHKGVPHD